MNDQRGKVLVLDDDPGVGRSLERLFQTQDIDADSFERSADLFAALPVEGPCCLVLDLDLGGTENGHKVLQKLRRLGFTAPVIFLTAYGDVPNAVRAMQNGAAHFLLKPYDPKELLEVIGNALKQAGESHRLDGQRAARAARAAALTERERQVLGMAMSGLLNKQIADELGLAVVTVKIHRGRAMRRLGVHTAAELARFADVIRPATPPAP